MLTGEPVPVEVGPGSAVVGGTVNAGGRLVVRATRVGSRHPAGPDGAAGRGGAARQDRGAAARRPDLGRVRARGRCVLSLATLVGWLVVGRLDLGRVHRGGRRADHRLPVRPRPGHADRADGRHRPGRAARHPDPRAGGARVHPPHRHGRPGQDRHRDHRPDEPGRAWWPPTARTPTTYDAWRRPSRAGPSTRSPRRSWPVPARCRRSTDFANLEGLGVRGTSSTGRRGGRRPAGPARRPRLAAAAGPRRRGRRPRSRSATPRSPSAGTGGPRRPRRRRHREGHLRRGGRAAARSRPGAGAADRRPRAGGARGRRRGRDRRGRGRGAARRKGRGGAASSRRRAASWRWSATA